MRCLFLFVIGLLTLGPPLASHAGNLHGTGDALQETRSMFGDGFS